jgi:hypothetical protein
MTKSASSYRSDLFPSETDPEIALLNALKTTSPVSSGEALELIKRVGSGKLTQAWVVNKKMTFVECELLEGAQHTLGTQCLIHLFDPGSGWIRDSRKRGDMLLMTAALVAKGVRLEGIFYYRGNPVITDQSVQQTVQTLISRRIDDPPATLNEEIKQIFTDAGYDFSYPAEFHSSPDLSIR